MTAEYSEINDNAIACILSDSKEFISLISRIITKNFKTTLTIYSINYEEIKDQSINDDINILIIDLIHNSIEKQLKFLKKYKELSKFFILGVTDKNNNELETLKIKKYFPIDFIYAPIIPELFIAKLKYSLQLFYYENKLKFVDKELQQIKYELKNQNKQLKHLALYDTLTSTPNRYLFEKTSIQIIKISQRYQHKFSMILIDLDNFKWINDKFGHNIGDEVLKAVAEKIKKLIRDSDMISRIGGDEFGLILSEIKKEVNAGNVADKILKEFKIPITIKKKTVKISLSIGITFYDPAYHKDFQVLMEEADIAMYRAKKSGKNRFEYFSKAQKEDYQLQNTLNYELHNALSKNELSLMYQPIVDIKSSKIVGLEALVRWNNTKLGEVKPLTFIPIAEETGLINEIGRWIIESVFQQIAIWRKLKIGQFVSVNISPLQLKNIRFGKELKDVADKYKIIPQDIELEITESAFASETRLPVSKYIKFLNEYKERLSIDDFGTEYSSICRLGQLPLHTLKIDGSLIENINATPKNKIILSTIINMAKELDMQIIAERIENREQVEFLKSQKCYLAQGYYFYEPVSNDQATKLLLEN